MIEKRYNKLNAKQLNLLTLLYKFRFINIPLLTQYKGLKSQTTLLRNLNKLEEQRYIGRRFDLSFKIDRKSAFYYLVANGINILKEDPRFNEAILHSYYKNKSVGEIFMQHSIDTLAVFNSIKNLYGSKFEIFTKNELSSFDDFPINKPDLFLRGDNEYCIMLSHDIQPFIIRKRLAEYISHSEEEGWNSGIYPRLLFILSNSSSEARFLDFAKSSLASAGIDDTELIIGATTIKAITNNQSNDLIWTFIDDPIPVSLS